MVMALWSNLIRLTATKQRKRRKSGEQRPLPLTSGVSQIGFAVAQTRSCLTSSYCVTGLIKEGFGDRMAEDMISS